MTKKDVGGLGLAFPAPVGRRPTGTGEASEKPKCFWVQHKTEAFLRILRGEDIEILSREFGVTAARLTRWREAFLAAGAEGLKKRPGKEAEVKRLNKNIGEQTMEIELLHEKIRLIEAKAPFCALEVEEMSQATSPSTGKTYGLSRVCSVWRIPRSTHCWRKKGPDGKACRPGPMGFHSDEELLGHIRGLIKESPFTGEGYRKTWASP